MELHNHPLMSYRGVKNWPPIWIPVDRQNVRVISGEVGILRHAQHDARYPARCKLIVEHEQEAFAGTLQFDDIAFCWLITNVLKNHVRRLIKDIGNLDLSYTL
jgi:hypothetical protein